MNTCTTRPVLLNQQWRFMIWSDLSLSCQQALVRRAEDVIHTLSKSVQLSDVREPWVDDLHRLKENLRSSVQHLYQTLRNVSDFHYTLNRVCAFHLLTKSLPYWWCCIMAFDLVYVCHSVKTGTSRCCVKPSCRICLGDVRVCVRAAFLQTDSCGDVEWRRFSRRVFVLMCTSWWSWLISLML